MGGIPSGSELCLHPFPFIRAIRAAQIFILEFSKDGSADLGNEFVDGGSPNQSMILQGVGLSHDQVSQCNCQFQSNGFLKFVTDILSLKDQGYAPSV